MHADLEIGIRRNTDIMLKLYELCVNYGNASTTIHASQTSSLSVRSTSTSFSEIKTIAHKMALVINHRIAARTTVTAAAAASLVSQRLHPSSTAQCINRATSIRPSTPRRIPRVSGATSLRPFHSQFHPRLPTHEYTNSQTAILTAALEHIPAHGFTKEALIRGAHDVGFLDVSIQLFPQQEMDLILYWLASRRGLLRGKVESGGLFEGLPSSASVDDKVKILILERLRMNRDVIHRWQDVRPCSPVSSCPWFGGNVAELI